MTRKRTNTRKQANQGQARGRALKAQFGMLEYLLLGLFMMVIIVGIVFFLFQWEFSSADKDRVDQAYGRSLFLMKLFTHSDFFTEKPGVLDDSKLMMTRCEDIIQVLGQKACINITTVLFAGTGDTPCTLGNYPDCTSWVICPDLCSEGALLGYDIPVNIYRRVGGSTDLGLLDLRIRV